MLDGGETGAPDGPLDAWLVTDAGAELIREIRAAARERSVEPAVARFGSAGLTIRPRKVAHTSHETYGCLIEAEGLRVAWAPEFWRFPRWAYGVDLLFADAAGWDRPIRFAGGVGGHAATLDVAAAATAPPATLAGGAGSAPGSELLGPGIDKAMADEIHVMPGKRGWEVREAGTFEPVSAHPSPEDAHAAGSELARRQGAELVVHDANGEVLARERPTPE